MVATFEVEQRWKGPSLRRLRVLTCGTQTFVCTCGADFQLGQRVELYPSNLDMSTNVYDRYYVTRGEQVVDLWPIMGRSGSAQR